MGAHNNRTMRAQRFAVLLPLMVLLGCADNLVPLTAHWNQAQVVMLKRIAELKASIKDLHLNISATPAMAINNWQSDEVRASMRAFEQGVVDLEAQFQASDLAVTEALGSGKLSVAKPAIDRAENDFDAAVKRLYPMPAQIHAALGNTRR
jgi:hypothetical protein